MRFLPSRRGDALDGAVPGMASKTATTLPIPVSGAPVPEEYLARLDRLDRFADLLDSRYRIPGTSIRFGWDPIVGLVPVAGDLVMVVASLQLMAQARGLGADRAMLTRMGVNVAIDFLAGSVPIIGPIFDLFFRANLRNLKLLTDEIQRRRRKGS
jgi:hypothetical protein